MDFCHNFTDEFSENDEMSRYSHKKCPKNAEKGRKFRNWCQILFVHFIFSITSLGTRRMGEGAVSVAAGPVLVQEFGNGRGARNDPLAWRRLAVDRRRREGSPRGGPGSLGPPERLFASELQM